MGGTNRKQNIRRGILVCGAYGMGNLGDEAILEAIIAQMRQIDPEVPITVMSRNPEETAQRHGVDTLYTFDIPGFFRAALRAKLYINGGGSLIQDVTSRRSLLFYLFTLRAAKACGCKVMMYGCGIGPVTRPGDSDMVRRTLNRSVDMITLREWHSRDELYSFGVTQPELILASDPAMVLSSASMQDTDDVLMRHGIDPQGRYIAFCLRRWPGYQAKAADFAELARYAYTRYHLTPIFLSINHRSDGEAAECVTRQMNGLPCFVLHEPMRTDLTIGILSRMQAVVSMRLHGLIFSAGNGIPLVGISYDPKITSFLDYMEQKNYIELQNVSGADLRHLLDAALLDGQNRQLLLQNAQRLRNRADLNRACAEKLLGETTHEQS